ncbi:hypothetical protein [Umezawaea sp. Da 62-37]|uniref:hypothetical protein n=1 Tax=Umezawaea sp. Da 62-37 TaxID=3075927 RepID=UPI0028F6D13A|nr:hypothetical protein [Umezawaea sp. Da 62-37]WNV83857.1 hypothetical protein RM788_37635 [Umezawaea sp. Da 62-37]
MAAPRKIPLSTTGKPADNMGPVVPNSRPAGIDPPDVAQAMRTYFGTRKDWTALPNTHHYIYVPSFRGRAPLREDLDVVQLSCVTDDPDFVSVESCGVWNGCTRHKTEDIAVHWTSPDGSPFLSRLDRVLARLIPLAHALDDIGDCVIFGECARALNARESEERNNKID